MNVTAILDRMGLGGRVYRVQNLQRAWLLLIAGFIAGCPTKSTGPEKVQSKSDSEIQRLEANGLHNLFRVSDRIFSGSNPEGDAGFASFRDLGIKTIVSVDGTKPDLALAEKYGLQYVHLPFGYDGVPRNRILELAKLSIVNSGPFYVHCHHGLHRGPVAVAVMQLCAEDHWDAAKAELWLQQAGTSPQYPGLIHIPRTLSRPTNDELAKVPNEFAATSPENDIVNLMVDVDARWDRLKLVRTAGWSVPVDHPDIDPPHEARQLLEHYREAVRLQSVQKRGTALVQYFQEAERTASTLESELRSSPINVDTTAAAFLRAAGQCAKCHNQFRDRPRNP